LLVLYSGEGGREPPTGLQEDDRSRAPRGYPRNAIIIATRRAKLLVRVKIDTQAAMARRKERKAPSSMASKARVKVRGKERKTPSIESASLRAAATNMLGNYDEVGGPSSSTHGQVYIIRSFFVVIGFSVFLFSTLLDVCVCYCSIARGNFILLG